MGYVVGEKQKDNTLTITFDVNSEDWKAALKESYQKNKGKYKAEGFRQGKVPMKVVENMYGIEVFYDDALNIILSKEYFKAIDAEKIEPVAQPDINIVAISDSTLKFTAKVTLKPEVVLGKYTGLNVKRGSVRVTAAEVDEAIKKEQDKVSTWTTVSDRAAQMGDKVNIDFAGTLDGVAFAGGTAEKQDLELGSGTFIPGFEEQVVGLEIGGKKDINVTFPADYGEKSLAGKAVVFAITLNSIMNKDVPAIDDEFVKDVSPNCNTVAEYKDFVKANLKEAKEKEVQAKLEQDIIDKIASAAKVDIPQVMVDEQTERSIEEFEQRFAQQGMDPEMYYKYAGVTKDDIRKQYAETSKKNVLYKLVFDQLFTEIKLDVTDDEVNAKLDEYAKQFNIKVEDMIKDYPNVKDGVKSEIRTEKLMKKLVEDNEAKK